MAFDIQNFALATWAANGNGPRTYVYESTDTRTTIEGTGYFNDMIGTLQVDDFIQVIGSSYSMTYQVTSVTTNVALLSVYGNNAITGNSTGNMATANTVGAPMIVFQRLALGSGTTTTPIVMTNKVKVLDCVVIMQGSGSAGDTVQLKNGSTNITNAMDISALTASGIARPTSIDDTESIIAAGGTLNIVNTDGAGSNNPSVDVYIYAARVA